MRHILLKAAFTSLLSFILNFLATGQTLVSKTFSSTHPEWKISKDTTSKEILFGFSKMEIPLTITWVVATDTSGCLRIGYFKITRNKPSSVKLSNLYTTNLPCAMKWESTDKTRFETLIFFGEYSGYKGIKQYTYKGSIGSVRGTGELTVQKLD